MPLFRLAAALLAALVLTLGGAGLCAPVAAAPPPACHGEGHVPEGTGNQTEKKAPAAPTDAPPTCLRCPMCASVVPEAPRLAVAPPAPQVALGRAAPSAPPAPPAEPSTPPPKG